MVVCPELGGGADLHIAQLMPLPLTVSFFSKIQIGFTFLVPAYLGSPGKRAVKRAHACVCVCVCVCALPDATAMGWVSGGPTRAAMGAIAPLTPRDQSINQSCIFRVVQVTKSLQDPLEVGNNLPRISDNVRE